MIKMSRFVANHLLTALLDEYFELAKKNGWTVATNIDDYLKHDHDAVYTTALLTAHNII